MTEYPYAPVGFFIHTAEMCHHYQPLWLLLGVDGFDVILHGSDEDKEEIRKALATHGYRSYDSLDIIHSGYRYPVVVSHISMHGYNKKPIIHALGIRRVRFMYALGKAKHNFASWNNDYDLILCFGPWQARKLSQCCNASIFQMGYPRYDAYFKMPQEAAQLPSGRTLDPGKKTILWLPTWKELSSLPYFVDVMGSLSQHYNIIVKTHPLSAAAEPEKLAHLSSYNFRSVITQPFDNLQLFRLADIVICDYGGTAFGAIYLDKPLLLFNLPNPEQDPLVGSDSPDVLLRQHIVNIDASERWQLQDIIEDQAIWRKQRAVRQELRNYYFLPSYGFSAVLAFHALQNVENIIRLTRQDN
ncbi:CDP-glycerol glycerophosphotransferase family protein [Rheinheimera sp. FR7-31]|uniref:CDP-glycerol glycerophosphotransferase family protein n=1 Tax=Rheinheimera fenheensis TaxID=3152295 RepID=UPI00325F5920